MELGLEGLSVFIAMPVYGEINPETVRSLMASWQACKDHGVNVELHMGHGSSRVQAARNIAAYEFYKSDKNRLFWIDSDMVWEVDSFLKILALSSSFECVGACYRLRKDPPAYCVRGITPGVENKLNSFGCISVEGMGIGFTCIQRKVMEALRDKAPIMVMADADLTLAHEIFTSGSKLVDDKLQDAGEDMRLFDDIRSLGFDVWMDPTIRLGHAGHKVYWGAFEDVIKEANMPKDFRAGKGSEWTAFYNICDLSERESWLRSKLGQIGNDVCIRAPFYCELGSNIHLGDNVFLNTNCTLSDVDTIVIGSRTLLGPGVQIYTGYHDKSRNQAAQTLCKPVVIGERCWIGGGAIILPGVKIGEGATVGAGAVVTKDVAPATTVAGNPAKSLKGENYNGPTSESTATGVEC